MAFHRYPGNHREHCRVPCTWSRLIPGATGLPEEVTSELPGSTLVSFSFFSWSPILREPEGITIGPVTHRVCVCYWLPYSMLLSFPWGFLCNLRRNPEYESGEKERILLTTLFLVCTFFEVFTQKTWHLELVQPDAKFPSWNEKKTLTIPMGFWMFLNIRYSHEY